MALLFSKATITSADHSTTFLIGGAPSSSEAFEGWTAYATFIDTVDSGSQVNAHVTAYTYGEEELVEATPEEVAYMNMRLQDRPDFLESRCTEYATIDFNFVA